MEDLGTYLLIGLAAYAAGIMNALAGGGTLLTFPALTLVIPLVEANITSTVALVPGSAASAWGMRGELAGTRPWMLLLLGPSLLGGLIGSLLLTLLPENYFALVVPWLLLLASLLYWLQPWLKKWLGHEDDTGLPPAWLCLVVFFFQLLVGVYGGYFGAGIGILMISALSLMGLGEVQRINAVKTVLAAAINGVSVLVFLWTGRIVWKYVPVMAVAAILGGLSGARLNRILPGGLLRWLIIGIGLALAAYYFIKQQQPTLLSPENRERKVSHAKAIPDLSRRPAQPLLWAALDSGPGIHGRSVPGSLALSPGPKRDKRIGSRPDQFGIEVPGLEGGQRPGDQEGRHGGGPLHGLVHQRQEVRQQCGPRRPVHVQTWRPHGDPGLGRRRGRHESRRQAQTDHPLQAGLRRGRSASDDSRQSGSDLRG